MEEQVRDMTALEESYKAIQNENYQLRDYIIILQSRLIESQGEDAVPPAPILITHQQQQQTLPFQPHPSGVATIPHAPPTQGQAIHAPAQAAPTAPMGVPVPVPSAQQMAPQAPMMSVPQPASQVSPQQAQQQQTQQVQQAQQAQQVALDSGVTAVGKRALDEGDNNYSEYVKKLRGEDTDTPVASVSVAAVDGQEVNGTKS